MSRALWGAATCDLGVFVVAKTRREALAGCGFATPITRERSGAFYIYTTADNNQAIVGRLRDLREEFSAVERR